MFYYKSLWTKVLYIQTSLAIRLPYRRRIHLFSALSIGCRNVADKLQETMDEPTHSGRLIAGRRKNGEPLPLRKKLPHHEPALAAR